MPSTLKTTKVLNTLMGNAFFLETARVRGCRILAF